MADKKVEKLLVQALGPVENIVKLQPCIDIEIVADMARLEIEIDIADLPRPAGLGELDAQSDVERDGGVPDTAQRRQKGNDGRPPLSLDFRLGRDILPVDQLRDFLQRPTRCNPFRTARADQPFVIRPRNLVAHQDKEDAMTVS